VCVCLHAPHAGPPGGGRICTPSTMASGNLESKDIWGDGDGDAAGDGELAGLTAEEVRQRAAMTANNNRIARSDITSLDHLIREQTERIKDNNDKIKLNKQLPYLVANVVEVRGGQGGGRPPARPAGGAPLPRAPPLTPRRSVRPPPTAAAGPGAG
jgi:hypothetical protein